jgi:NtrC-family two-component system sensor histidine kinase KinB
VLRTRLFLNLMPFVVILLAIGVYAIVLFSRLANSVDASVTEKYRSVMAAQAMTLALAGMDREVPWISGGERNPDSHAFAEHQKQFEENLAIELKSLMLPGEKELSQELASQYHTFQEAMGRISALRKSEAQHQVYDDEITPSVRTMNSLLEKIRDLNHEAVLSTSQSIQRITRDVTRLMLIGMVIALVISAYACLQLSRSILRPIQSLTQASRELGEGNLGQLVPVLSRDELGDLAVAFNKMAAQLQEYRQSTTDEIVRLHRTMETTLASFPDPIFVLNKDGRIDLKNPAAADLASNLHLKDCLPERLAAIAQKALQSGENFLPHSFDEVVSFRFNGEEKFLLPRILAMRTKDDALFGVAVVLYDVTRFRLLDAVKTNLVATVSHELKSPLTSVRMVLYILLEETVGGLTAKQRELLITARSDADRLLRILNDLLDLTRLEEGNAGLHKEPIATADLVQSASKEMNDQAAAKGLKLNCIVDPQLPAVSVDRQRINHVFTNLIANAIKHSPAGGEIVLRAALAEDNDVQFSITDQGPGIPEEYHTRIFERFFRVPGQSKSGAGLGLSIAREITLAHGGRIGVKSAIGQGSSFYVVLKGQRT